jgi:hypothetical protein
MIHGSLCLVFLLSISVIEACSSISRGKSDWGKDMTFVPHCERNGNNPQTQACSGNKVEKPSSQCRFVCTRTNKAAQAPEGSETKNNRQKIDN